MPFIFSSSNANVSLYQCFKLGQSILKRSKCLKSGCPICKQDPFLTGLELHQHNFRALNSQE